MEHFRKAHSECMLNCTVTVSHVPPAACLTRPGSVVRTDACKGYSGLESLGYNRRIVRPTHLDYYLDEYTFRFTQRTSNSRGMLFFRLPQQAVAEAPHTGESFNPDFMNFGVILL